MAKSFTDFLDQMKSNPNFLAKLQSTTSLDDLVKLANDNGFDLKEKQFKEIIQAGELLKKQESGELTEGELESVAGGFEIITELRPLDNIISFDKITGGSGGGQINYKDTLIDLTKILNNLHDQNEDIISGIR